MLNELEYDNTTNNDTTVNDNQDDSTQNSGLSIEKDHHEQAEEKNIDQKVETDESPTARNFRLLREKAERLERENISLKNLTTKKEISEQIQSSEDDDEEIDFNIGDDDLAEGKHLKVYKKELDRIKKQLNQQQQANSVALAEARIKAQYPDFENVVNDDTVLLLRESYPEVAESIASNQNIYNKAIAAYTTIKRLGIYVPDNYKNDKIRAQSNSSKPRPTASVSPQQGDSPLSNANAFANGLTPELKQQLLKEMSECRKRN